MFFAVESILLNVYLFQLSFGCYLFGIVVFHPFPPKLSMHFCFSSIFCQGNLDAFLLFNQFDNICLILTSRWFWWPVQPVHCSTIFDFYSSHSFRASLFSPLLMFKNIELLACVLIPESRPSCLRWAECFQLVDRGSCPLASWLCSEVPHPTLPSARAVSIFSCPHLVPSSPGVGPPGSWSAGQTPAQMLSYSWAAGFPQFSCLKVYIGVFLPLRVFGVFLSTASPSPPALFGSYEAVTFLGSRPLPPSSQPAVTGWVLTHILAHSFAPFSDPTSSCD